MICIRDFSLTFKLNKICYRACSQEKKPQFFASFDQRKYRGTHKEWVINDNLKRLKYSTITFVLNQVLTSYSPIRRFSVQRYFRLVKPIFDILILLLICQIILQNETKISRYFAYFWQKNKKNIFYFIFSEMLQNKYQGKKYQTQLVVNCLLRPFIYNNIEYIASNSISVVLYFMFYF